MKLVYRNGFTVYINGDTQYSCDCMTQEQVTGFQVAMLNDSFDESELKKAMQIDFTDTDIAESIQQDDRFVFNEDGSVFRTGINLSIPKLLLEEYLAADDERFAALDNFWMWCCLNPNPEARNSLFDYLINQKLVITNTGMIITYRNVNLFQKGNKELHDFIVNNHLKVKTVWKKSVKDYYVVDQNGLKLVHTDKLNPIPHVYGTLKYCYNNIQDFTETIYTDAHTGRERYKIGVESRMPREKCDSNSSNDCSFGYHSGNQNFVTRGNFGQEGILVLINPMDVVAVPSYNVNKMRSCAFYPVGIINWDNNGNIIEPETTIFEDDYTNVSLENLNIELAKADLKEHTIHKLDVESVGNMFKAYTDEMADTVQKRNIYYEEE